MTFGQFLSILLARKWAALSVFALVVSATVAVSLWLPKQYSASASVLIDAKPDPVAALAYPMMAAAGFMATQVDILTSDRVTLKVIRDLKLLDSQQLRDQWQESTEGKGTIEQWLISVLQRGLDVKPSRESNVIQVIYKSPDPRFAAGLANAFVQAYVATTLELRVDPAKQFTSFFNTQAKEARDALERAQTKVSSFQREKGIIASDERLDVENSRLNELSSQLVMIQGISSESGSRQSLAQGATGDRIQEVLNNPVIGQIKTELTRAEARLQELNSKFGESHPQVVEAKASIAEMRSRIDSETRKVTGGVSVTNTINKQREAQVKRELADQRTKVLRMKAVRDEGQVLIREVESAQRSYDSLMARLNQTSIEAQSTQSYANILTVAQPPSDHASPKVLINTLISIVLGSMLAVGVALLMELSNRRIRAADDIVASLGLPVLGTLPKPSAKRFNAGKRISLMQQRVIGLPAPIVKGS